MRLAVAVITALMLIVTMVGAAVAKEGDDPAVVVPDGFRVEKLVEGLTYATGLAWDDEDRMYVLEAGGQFLEEPTPARILHVADDGSLTEVVDLSATGVGDSVVGLEWYDGEFYFTHRDGADRTGAVSKVTPDGEFTPLFSGIIDSQAEHQVNDIKLGPDGRMYVASGPAGNSAVVGPDIAPFVQRSPDLHTTSCVDIVLTGRNFETPDFRTDDENDTTRTGAYVPFGTETEPGQVIEGRTKCGGAILAFDPADPEGSLDVYAHGFRNIIGFTWDDAGAMYAAVNGYDVRGARPVRDEWDATYRIEEGAWYGWPDFSATLEPLTDPKFDAPDDLQAPIFIDGEEQPKELGFVIDHEASGLEVADGSLVAGLHEFNSSPSMLDVAPDSWGAWAGQLFVAEFGDLAPATNPLRDERAGFLVSRIDPATRMAVPFATNPESGPASAQGLTGRALERPFDVKFGPDGAMYVSDFGIGEIVPDPPEGQVPYNFPAETGAIWKITAAAVPDTATLEAPSSTGSPVYALLATFAIALVGLTVLLIRPREDRATPTSRRRHR